MKSFRLYKPECPECGSKNRRLALENLRKSAELGYPKARKVLKKMESVE